MDARKRLLVLGLLAGIFACVAMTAGGAETSLSAAPAEDPQFQPGDTVVVAAGQAKLMRGDEVVATLPQGRRIVVVEVQKAWVGTYILVNNEKKAGWIHISHFMPRELPASQGYLTAYPAAAYLSQAATVPYGAGVTPRTSALAEATDPFLAGRQRHETDPNMHVWEPWRR